MFYYLTSNGARVGDNVVFARELFDPSCVKVGLSQDSCVYIFGYLEARVASIINPFGTRLKIQGECSVFLHITQLLCTICDITMSRR